MPKFNISYFLVLILGLSFEKNITYIEIPVNGTIVVNKTEDLYSYLYLNVQDYYKHNKIDLDVSFHNEYQDHLYGIEYKEDYDNKENNFVNLVKVYSGEYTNKGKYKETYSTFHFHIYLNLSPRYLLFKIYTYSHGVTITHKRPSSSNSSWKTFLIVIGVVALSAICFFFGRISKSITCNDLREPPLLAEIPPDFLRLHQEQIQPNNREAHQQEMQPNNHQQELQPDNQQQEVQTDGNI